MSDGWLPPSEWDKQEEQEPSSSLGRLEFERLMENHDRFMEEHRKRELEHPTKFILDEEGNPVPEPDLLKWGKWIEENSHGEAPRRIIDKTKVGNAEVSTVFLGVDHCWTRFLAPGEEHIPILFETMVFGDVDPSQDGLHDQKQWRYSTRQEALDGHMHVVGLLLGIEKEDDDGGEEVQGS